MLLSSSSRNLCNVFVPGQLVQRCIIHWWFDGSHTTLLTRFLYVTSQFRVLWLRNGFLMSRTDTYRVCSWWTCNGTSIRAESTKYGESNFCIWISQNATKIHGDCAELTTFVCEHLSACFHNPFFREAVCCIHHHRRHERDQLFLWSLLYFFSWNFVQVLPFFALVLLHMARMACNHYKVLNIHWIGCNHYKVLNTHCE